MSSDRLSSINEVGSIGYKKNKLSDATSDEGFNSGNQSPEVQSDAERKKRRRARRNRSDEKSTSSVSDNRRTKRSSSKDPYVSKI